MIYVKKRKRDFEPFSNNDNLRDYLTEPQCKGIIEARNKIDNLLFTKNYYVSFFDIYISDYACCIVFEVDNIDRDAYLQGMRGQWFIDTDGTLYMKDGDNREYITDSIYHFVAKIRRDIA